MLPVVMIGINTTLLLIVIALQLAGRRIEHKWPWRCKRG